MSLLACMLRRWRSRRRLAGIVIATLSVAAALLPAATLSAGSAAAASLTAISSGVTLRLKLCLKGLARVDPRAGAKARPAGPVSMPGAPRTLAKRAGHRDGAVSARRGDAASACVADAGLEKPGSP
jgi:hypothetical protein